jgi:hypothetical protein
MVSHLLNKIKMRRSAVQSRALLRRAIRYLSVLAPVLSYPGQRGHMSMYHYLNHLLLHDTNWATFTIITALAALRRCDLFLIQGSSRAHSERYFQHLPHPSISKKRLQPSSTTASLPASYTEFQYQLRTVTQHSNSHVLETPLHHCHPNCSDNAHD